MERDDMGAFEFLTAFVSILIGLAIADLATSLHRLLRAGRRVKWDWATPAAALVVAIQVMAQFWVFWFSRTERTYTFASTTALAGVLVIVFLMASAALPDEAPEAGLDLRAFYDANRRYLWGLYALYTVVVTLQEADVFATPTHRWELLQNGFGLLNLIAMALIPWRWLQAVGIAGIFAFEVSRYFMWSTTGPAF